jgi:aspartate beta-hydroxylase
MRLRCRNLSLYLCWLVAAATAAALHARPSLPSSSARRSRVVRCQLASAIDASLRSRFDERHIGRVLSAWQRMRDGMLHDEPLPSDSLDPMMRQQANSFIEGLPTQPFHDASQLSWVRGLEGQWEEIAAELASVLARGGPEQCGGNDWAGIGDATGGRDATAVSYGPEWRTLGLQDRGLWDPLNMRIFPRTTAALRECEVPCVEAFFAKMAAGSDIKPHSDGCNFHLTSHLGLDVPEGECSLKVGDVTREWRNGELLLFDTSILHSAKNEAAVDRYVLMMRLWHPDLAPREIEALQHIFDCLDDPSLAAPPPQPRHEPRSPARSPQQPAQSGAGSRAERRAAAKAAKKAAKKAIQRNR